MKQLKEKWLRILEQLQDLHQFSYFFSVQAFKFILTDCTPPDQVSPNETPLEQVDHKGLDSGEGEDGGQVEEGDQLGHKVWASPEPIFNSHACPRSADNCKKMQRCIFSGDHFSFHEAGEHFEEGWELTEAQGSDSDFLAQANSHKLSLLFFHLFNFEFLMLVTDFLTD